MIDRLPEYLSSITDFLQFNFKSKDIWSILTRIMLGALVYMIWQERNNRIHLKKATSSSKLQDEILKVVRLRYSGIGFEENI